MLHLQFLYVTQADASATPAVAANHTRPWIIKSYIQQSLDFLSMHTENSPSFHRNPCVWLLSLFSIRGAVPRVMQAQNRSSVHDSISPFSTSLWPPRSVQPLNFPTVHLVTVAYVYPRQGKRWNWCVCVPIASTPLQIACAQAIWCVSSSDQKGEAYCFESSATLRLSSIVGTVGRNAHASTWRTVMNLWKYSFSCFVGHFESL